MLVFKVEHNKGTQCSENQVESPYSHILRLKAIGNQLHLCGSLLQRIELMFPSEQSVSVLDPTQSAHTINDFNHNVQQPQYVSMFQTKYEGKPDHFLLASVLTFFMHALSILPPPSGITFLQYFITFVLYKYHVVKYNYHVIA